MRVRKHVGILLISLFVGSAACDPANRDVPGSAEASTVMRAVEDGAWPTYGGDPGGSRYSPLNQINTGNVAGLQEAWRYELGEAAIQPQRRQFEATPILLDGTMYVSTPLNRVIALDPETGAALWSFDPNLDRTVSYSESFTSRGVASWVDSAAQPGSACARRIFLGTVDARLIAIDARTGDRCPDFGSHGTVDLSRGIDRFARGEYGLTSPPLVAGDLVVVGSAIGDNRRRDVESGIVRAFDARDGSQRWSLDPIPRTGDEENAQHWDLEQARGTGAANSWGVMSFDEERGLIFVPTGSAAPDFYGGERVGDNAFANSVVAIEAATGAVLWYFQTVHHDLWDYDVAAQPVLFNLRRDGAEIPAVAVGTKQGHIFVLHRESGEPLFPVEERAVPSASVPGEEPWPTQPFPLRPPALLPQSIGGETWGVTDEDRSYCQDRTSALKYQGTFTPPSLEGTLIYPGSAGGINWASVAIDAERQLLVVGLNHSVGWVRLIPRERWDSATADRQPGVQYTGQRGTPYGMSRSSLRAPSGLSCAPPPWGELVAIDLSEGAVRWRKPIGIHPSAVDLPGSAEWGAPVWGGVMITGGGLAFLAATADRRIRAADVADGTILWEHELPGAGEATPMTFLSPVSGAQYVVIAADDHVVAFGLPD